MCSPERNAQELLTVMYLTSMSVFLSSSDIISRWNLLNFRWRKRRRRERRGEEERHTDDYKLDRRMKCYSLSAANTRRVSQRESVHLECICAGVRAESEVALMNESETKRGKCPQTSLQLSLISVRVSECLHHRSLVAKQRWRRRRPHGADQ